jgi:hypothetical protein
MTTTAPVLFLIFNRPETTTQVMEAIRAARPPRLYVAADGPRERLGEAESCEKVRQIAIAADWPCQVHTLFRNGNLGCRRAVGSAIDWFFEHEEEGIILEDDCVPSAHFFRFCDELLPRFRSETRVMAICGSCYTRSTFDIPESYYFSYYPDIWGWATWRRAWRLYDRDLSRWPEFKQSGRLRSAFNGNSWRETTWSNYFDQTATGKIDTWDYQWIYTVIEQNGLACYPTRNLVSNVGWQSDATVTKVEAGSDPGPLACRPHEPYHFPLRHPGEIVRSEQLDRELEKLRFFYVANSQRSHNLVRACISRVLRHLPVPIKRHFTTVRAVLKKASRKTVNRL